MRPALASTFHDAAIAFVDIGPRREIRIHLDLGSARQTDETLPPAGVLRFGGIENLEAVSEFFADFRQQDDDACHDRVEQIRVLDRDPGKKTTRVLMQLDHAGDVQIKCLKISFEATE